MRHTSILLFLVFLLAACEMTAQEEEERDSSFRLRVNLNCGLIVNNSFSNIKKKVPAIDEYTTETWKQDTAGGKYRAGFEVGSDFLFFPREHFKGVIGISFSQTSVAYYYQYVSEGPTSRPGYTTAKTTNNMHYALSFSSLNFRAGIRNQIVRQVYLTSSLALTKPVIVKQSTSGNTGTVYSNNSGGSDSISGIFNEETKKVQHPPQNLSFHFSVEYQFALGTSMARVYLSRYFGLIYLQPWWGLGFSYTVKK